MSIRVYLSKGIEKELTKKWGPTGNIFWTTGNDSVTVQSDGRFYVTLDVAEDSIPEVIKDFVEEISLLEMIRFNLDSRREGGVYEHETAVATLDVSGLPGSSVSCYLPTVRIRAKHLEDLRELLQMIRAGSIRPTVSYEGPQSGMSRLQLEEQLRIKSEENTNLEKMIKDERAVLDVARSEISNSRILLVDILDRFSNAPWSYPSWWLGMPLRKRIESRINSLTQVVKELGESCPKYGGGYTFEQY